MSANLNHAETSEDGAALPSQRPTPMDQAEAREHARRIVARSGTSFLAGMRVLARNRREGMYAVYAFCREVDDIADEGGGADEKLAALDGWRQELERLYSGTPTYPTSLALADPIQEFNLPKEEFLLVIEGMEMDARGPIVAPPMDVLLAYCRRVAGAVGLLSIRIFGAPDDPKSTEFALSLADALQLTNILRDVAEDAAMGRVYLPHDLLEKHGVHTRDPLALLKDPGLGGVCEDLAKIAHERFERARASLTRTDLRVMRPALLMMGIYEQTLKRLEERGWAHAAVPIKLSKLEKLATALRWTLWPPV